MSSVLFPALLFCLALLLGSGCGASGDSPSHRAGFGRVVDLAFEVGGRQRRAAVYVPRGYDESGRSWPLIVFLHGLGERGDDGREQMQGLLPAIEEHPERFPCLVLMPQCPADRVWVEIDASWARGHPSAPEHIDAALAAARREYRVDGARIALTGLSMGGFGTLIHGARRAQDFSAMVALCGGGRVEDAPTLARVPLWLIHGARDEVVPESSSTRMVEAVRAAGGDVRFTSYADLAHDVWSRAYHDPEVIAFLLGSR